MKYNTIVSRRSTNGEPYWKRQEEERCLNILGPGQGPHPEPQAVEVPEVSEDLLHRAEASLSSPWAPGL